VDNTELMTSRKASMEFDRKPTDEAYVFCPGFCER
jgi:hypothetical protein